MSGCPGACSPTLPINSPWYCQPGGDVGASDKPESRVSPRGANCVPRHLEPTLCGHVGTTRRHMRAVFGHQRHEGLQGFVPKRGVCPPLIISDYIDHLALTKGFTYPNNLKYSLTWLALAMLACLPSFFVNARVCSKPPTGAQPSNEPPSKQTKRKKNGPRGGAGGVGRSAGNFSSAPSDKQLLVLSTVPLCELPGYGAFRLDANTRVPYSRGEVPGYGTFSSIKGIGDVFIFLSCMTCCFRYTTI